MAGSLVALGFLALLGQVVLLRETAVAAYGSELAIVLALGVWLLGTAAGAALGGAGRARPTPDRVARLFLLAGTLVPLAVVWSRAARPLLGGVRGGDLPFTLQLTLLGTTLLPVGAALGALFPSAARLAAARGGSVARAYALECAGALLGGLAATTAARVGVPNLALALLCAGGGAWPLVRRARRLLAAAAGLALLGLLLLTPRLDFITTGWTHPGLIETRDSPYGRVTLETHAGQVTVFVNDALAYETEGAAAEEFAALAALQVARPDRVLVLGGGAAGLTRELLRHGPQEIVTVDLDPVLQRMLARRLPADLRATLADPRVRAVTDDPRRWLARDDGAWDLIVIGLPEPASGATNRFYTREFFKLCATRLARGGVLALRLPAAENLWAPALVRRTASVVGALRTAFADPLVLPGAAGIVLASSSPPTRDPALLVARLEARAAAGPLVTPAYVRYVCTNDRLDGIAALLAATRVEPNSDVRPVCYPYTLALWLAKFYPALARFDATPEWRGAADPRLAGLAALALLWWLVRRAGRPLVAAAVVGAAGCAGMLLEGVLLLAFQTRHGALYRDLGLLLTAFMAGLAAGAWATDRAPAGGWLRQSGKGPLSTRAPLAALALGGVLLALRLPGGSAPGPLEISLWLALAGAATAAVFARAARSEDDPARAAGALYAADLLGGCLGSLTGGLWLLPVAGWPGTALLAAALAAGAALWP